MGLTASSSTTFVGLTPTVLFSIMILFTGVTKTGCETDCILEGVTRGESLQMILRLREDRGGVETDGEGVCGGELLSERLFSERLFSGEL